MSTLPARTPRRGLRWKRWAVIDVIAAAIMTYIEVAVLGVIGDIINALTDSNAGDQPVLVAVIGIFAFFVNLFVAVIFTFVIGVFVSLFTGGRSKVADDKGGGATVQHTEP